MNTSSLNLKLILGITYLIIITIGLYFLFSAIDIKDLTDYEFIRSNKNIILKYKSENLLTLTFVFFIFCIIWVLLLGFATPLLLFAGFVFGKWWGIFIVLTSTTLGATLLYMLANFFFRDFVLKTFETKFSKFKEFFSKNDTIYFLAFRVIGGAGTPYSIQNVLPIFFAMPVKNYFIATFLGCFPSMFITCALGDGIQKVIDQNVELTFTTVLFSPNIYIPIIAFILILIFAFVIKKIYFKN